MFGKRLAALRKQNGMSQNDLANQLDLSRGQLSNYELETREPDFDTLHKITNYFEVTADYLLGFSDSFKELTAVYDLSSSKGLPVLGTIRSGMPILADENIAGYLNVPDSIQADFILTAKDDSMAGAGILKGDHVLCSNTKAAKPGQVVMAIKDLANGFSEEIIRFYIKEGNASILRSANPFYPDIYANKDYLVAGVMVALFRKETPEYQVFQNYSTACYAKEWSEVIDLSSQAGLNVKQVKDILLGQIEIAKKIRYF